MSLVDTPINPVEIFCAYSHEDEKLRIKLEKRLTLLKQQNLVTIWHDRIISPDKEWEDEIDAHLDTAQIILLLISPSFLGSEYSYGIEMKRALERHEQGEARVIPIILRPVYWQETPISKLQALPSDAEPITSSRWHNQDEAFLDVEKGIRKAIKEFAEFVTPKTSLSTQLKLQSPFLSTSSVIKITSKRHVLFIDDDEFLRKIMKDTIESALGLYVTCLEDGREGLHFIQRIHVDLILLDLAMNSIGGLVVIEQLRQLGIKTPIIVVSAGSNLSLPMDEEKAATICGVNAFLLKPFQMERLIDLIKKYIDEIN
jgi:CheY-like chemotaxis protein